MRDGSSTRKRLERCALNLFVEKGITATTIKDIANSAEIAEGTLYRHYTSKDELAESLFLKAYEVITSEIRQSAEKLPSIKAKLRAMIFFFCQKYDEDPILFRYLLLSQHHQMQILTNKEYSAHAQLLPIVQEALQKNELALRDADFYVSIILGIVLQAALSRVYDRIERPMLQDAEDLVNSIYGALNLPKN